MSEGEGTAAGLASWARAIALGIRDTATDVLREGRRGAAEAYDQGWKRYEKKTRSRRATPASRKRAARAAPPAARSVPPPMIDYEGDEPAIR